MARGYFTAGERCVLGPQYDPIFTELAVVGGLIVRGARIKVPKSLRDKVIKLAHEGHQGITKTKEYLRTRVWLPWTSGAQFIRVPAGHRLQAIQMDRGRIRQLNQYQSGYTQAGQNLRLAWHTWRSVSSDNGPPFNEQDFSDFSKYFGFRRERKTPLNPQANTEAEQFMRVVKKLYQISKLTGTNFKQEVYRFLRAYRATPHCTAKIAPSDLMYPNRKFRTRLPIGVTPREHDFEELYRRDLEKKMQMKCYADNKRNVKTSDIQKGDSVLVRRQAVNKATPAYDKEPLQVQHRKGTRVVAKNLMATPLQGPRLISREYHTDLLKKPNNGAHLIGRPKLSVNRLSAVVLKRDNSA